MSPASVGLRLWAHSWNCGATQCMSMGSASQRHWPSKTLGLDGFTTAAGRNWPIRNGFLKPRAAGFMKQYFIVVEKHPQPKPKSDFTSMTSLKSTSFSRRESICAVQGHEKSCKSEAKTSDSSMEETRSRISLKMALTDWTDWCV